MRKTLISVLSFAIFVSVFFACRKTELRPEAQQEIAKANNAFARFFSILPSASPQAKTVADAIKRQNQKHNFLSSVIKKAGYPVWDKVKVVDIKTGNISGRGASDSTGEVVYVPFVLDSQNRVNAVLSVKLNNPDTTFRMLYAARYKDFGYDAINPGKWSARDAFNFFTLFDYSVFGHTRFVVTDDSLFNHSPEPSFVVATLTAINGQPVSSRTNVASATVCVTIRTCTYNGTPCTAPNTPTNCTNTNTPLPE